jgi:hypothetical protein
MPRSRRGAGGGVGDHPQAAHGVEHGPIVAGEDEAVFLPCLTDRRPLSVLADSVPLELVDPTVKRQRSRYRYLAEALLALP